jgi:restriction system protein
MDAAIIRQSWQRQDDARWHAATSANFMFRNNALLLAGSDWNPEQNLQEEERLVVSLDDFRAGRITISDPALLGYLDKNPNDVFSLAPRQFEEFVAELLRKSGYDICLGAGSRDGGVDIRALRATEVGLDLTLVQCKRWDPSVKVGEPVVKQLYGSLSEQNASHGLIVTTSTFTSTALKFIERVKYRMDGKDFEKLKTWIRLVGEK